MSQSNDTKQNLIVIGNGMSGLRTIEDLFDITKDKYNITLFNLLNKELIKERFK